MFGDLGYCTRIERGVLKVLHNALIMAKGSNMCGLSILDGFTII